MAGVATCFFSRWHGFSGAAPIKKNHHQHRHFLVLHCQASLSGVEQQAALTSDDDAPGYGFRGKSPQQVRVMVTGSTGYIGRFVVQELVSRQFNVLAIARPKQKDQTEPTLFPGADLCLADVTDRNSLLSSIQQHLHLDHQPQEPPSSDSGEPEGNRREGSTIPRGQGLSTSASSTVDVLVCCLASRSGGVSDSWKIDYSASRNSIDAAISLGAKHIVLLSAICVQKPLLEFQRAKLKLEAEIQNDLPKEVSWSIVRPTAFFKSLGGQVEIIKSGGPFVVFGDGKLCSCKPISEKNLAEFIADCISDEKLYGKVLPIGGPGKAYTPLEQGEMLFSLAGKSPKFVKVPIQIMDSVISVFDWLANMFPGLVDAAEYAKIGRYYAAESMLVLNPETGEYDADATPSYGNDTLEQFFERVLREGLAGQELGEQAFFLKQNSSP